MNDREMQLASGGGLRDRRRDSRDPVIRRCRIRGKRSLLFASGVTQNTSPGGLLVGLPAPRAFAVGDEIEVVVSWGDDPQRRASTPTTGRIVRIEDRPPERRIAIALDPGPVALQVNPVRVAA